MGVYPGDTRGVEALLATAEEVDHWRVLVNGLEWSDETVFQSQGKSAPSDESLFPLLEWFGFSVDADPTIGPIDFL